jgi:hypothetical protein
VAKESSGRGSDRINARELWEQTNTTAAPNLILACIVYWQACEIFRVLSECDPARQRNRSLPAGTRAENLGPQPSGFVQFQMDKEGKLNLLRLSFDDGQAYEFRRE